MQLLMCAQLRMQEVVDLHRRLRQNMFSFNVLSCNVAGEITLLYSCKAFLFRPLRCDLFGTTNTFQVGEIYYFVYMYRTLSTIGTTFQVNWPNMNAMGSRRGAT